MNIKQQIETNTKEIENRLYVEICEVITNEDLSDSQKTKNIIEVFKEFHKELEMR